MERLLEDFVESFAGERDPAQVQETPVERAVECVDGYPPRADVPQAVYVEGGQRGWPVYVEGNRMRVVGAQRGGRQEGLHARTEI
eukprot:711719-Prymnesium_polylepis.1